MIETDQWNWYIVEGKEDRGQSFLIQVLPAKVTNLSWFLQDFSSFNDESLMPSRKFLCPSVKTEAYVLEAL